MFDDNKRPYNASRFLAVIHLDADISSSVIVDASDPAYNGSNLTERMTTRSLFVAKRTSFMVFELLAILLRVKIKTSHPSQFPPEDVLLNGWSEDSLVIAGHDFGISGQSDDPVGRDGEPQAQIGIFRCGR